MKRFDLYLFFLTLFFTGLIKRTNWRKTVKVIRLHNAKDFRIHNENVPEFGEDEVLLKIRAVGICGSDLGRYRCGRDADNEISKPLVLGHEFAAEVIKAGRDVKNLRPGQRVAVDPALNCEKCEWCLSGNPNLCSDMIFFGTDPVDGVLCEYVAYPARLCFPLPDSISYEEGAMLEPLGVVLHSVDLSHFKFGDSAAVLGSGTIGMLLIQMLKAMGASLLIATDPLDYRLNTAKYLGADFFLNPNKNNISEEINTITSGRGVDIVFEAAGALETPKQAAEIVRPGGKIILIGINSEERLEFNSAPVRRKGLTIKMIRRMKHTYPGAIDLYSKKQILFKPLLTHTFPFDKTAEAFKIVDSYSDGVIKATILMEDK